MRGVVLCLPVALLACGKKEQAASPTSASAPAVVVADDGQAADALWAFAPPAFTDAVVVTPHGLASLEAAVVALQHHVETQPALAQLAAPVTSRLHDILGGPFVSLDALGIDRTHGFGLWVTRSGFIAVLPIGDRAKLAKLIPAVGTDPAKLGPLPCKSQTGAYICASDEKMFDAVGKGRRPPKLDEVGVRGDVEGFTTVPWGNIAAALQLGAGAFTLHAKMDVPTVLADKGGPPISVANKDAAGFAVASLPKLAAFIPDGTTPFGVTTHQLANAFGDRVDATSHRGSLAPDVHVALVDPASLTAFIAHCKDFVPPQLLAAKQTEGGCTLHTPDWGMTADVWIEGKELRIGVRGAAPTVETVPRTPLGDEIANGKWTLAAWGRGTTMGAGLVTPPGGPGGVMVGLSLLSEIGVGVRIEHGSLDLTLGARTLYANPPTVVDKLLSLTPEKIADAATVKAIAASAPDSPFAVDLAAGQSGLLMPMSVLGFISAIAVPAVMDSMKKSYRTPIAVDLDRLAALAKTHYLETGAFPKGKVGPLPDKSCCKFAKFKCETKLDDWTGPFKELGFDVDKPTLYQLSYEGDGQSFTAHAIVDLDCDGVEVGWTVTGRVANGTPIIEVTEPPMGVD